MSGWINVGDKLPEQGIYVLMRVTCSNYFNIEQGYYSGHGRWVNCWCSVRTGSTYPVTHWMPLPGPPVE